MILPIQRSVLKLHSARDPHDSILHQSVLTILFNINQPLPNCTFHISIFFSQAHNRPTRPVFPTAPLRFVVIIITTMGAETAVVKAKKPRSPPAHPPFVEMITEAIVALKERTGSSQYAITKFVEEKHKQLPQSFKKLLLLNLKKLVASGKLVKVKASFKLPPRSSSAAAAPAKTEASKRKKTTSATAKISTTTKSKAKTVAKPKAKVAGKPKAKAKPAAKVARTSSRTSPGKKAKSPAKKAVKPKSVKSPAKKKVQPKRGKK